MTKNELEHLMTDVIRILINDSPCCNIQHSSVHLNFYAPGGAWHHYYDLEFNVADSAFDVYVDISNTGCFVVTDTEEDDYKRKVENYLLNRGFNRYRGDSSYVSDNDCIPFSGSAQTIARTIIRKFNNLTRAISMAMSQ